MSKILSKTLSHAMKVHEKRLAVTANNLANASTPGYRAVQLSFEMSKGVMAGSRSLNPAISSVTPYVDFSSAVLVQTGTKLDVAIEGNGFFVIATPSGIRYTRNGRFTLDEEKRLVTSADDRVMGEGGEILVVDGQDVGFELDGSIHVNGRPVGRLKVVDFVEKKFLQPVGFSLFEYAHEDSRAVPAEGYSIKQGFLEASNVDAMREMVNLIEILRGFEAYDKVKKMAADTSKKLVDLIAR
jgi:flagellar basal-body rod protein FlgF